MYLNTDDLHDPELAMVRSRLVGGTLAMWATHLDPFVSIYPSDTSSFTCLILQIPGYQVTIHVVVYLPTSGRENEFISELTSLRLAITELKEKYQESAIFIRGDSNANKNNKNRIILFNQFIQNHSLLQVNIDHKTYHHFTGEGLYDSEIDVVLHSDEQDVSEKIVNVRCKLDHPDMLSHHDMIMSECSFPALPVASGNSDMLVTAPRLTNNREKIIWSPEGTQSMRGWWLRHSIP